MNIKTPFDLDLLRPVAVKILAEGMSGGTREVGDTPELAILPNLAVRPKLAVRLEETLNGI